MVAAFRCGRQADALRAYQRCRAVLAGELGLEPGAELRRLEAAVLAQDPALDWHPAGGAAPAPPGQAGAQLAGPLPTAGPSLVGRDPELAHLRDRLQQARSGHGGAVVLVGEPGAGKTTIAEAGVYLATAADVTAV
jgi:Bacterial transcriptional activator domain/AAA ATPase domain